MQEPGWINSEAETVGNLILEILRQVRRHKAELGLSVGAELEALHISMPSEQRLALQMALLDLRSATRAKLIVLEEGEHGTAGQFLDSGELLVEI